MNHAPTLLAAIRARLQAVRGAVDRGASALELAVIAAVLVLAASFIGAAVYNTVQKKTTNLTTCANQPAGQPCVDGGGAGTAP